MTQKIKHAAILILSLWIAVSIVDVFTQPIGEAIEVSNFNFYSLYLNGGFSKLIYFMIWIVYGLLVGELFMKNKATA